MNSKKNIYSKKQVIIFSGIFLAILFGIKIAIFSILEISVENTKNFTITKDNSTKKCSHSCKLFIKTGKQTEIKISAGGFIQKKEKVSPLKIWEIKKIKINLEKEPIIRKWKIKEWEAQKTQEKKIDGNKLYQKLEDSSLIYEITPKGIKIEIQKGNEKKLLKGISGEFNINEIARLSQKKEMFLLFPEKNGIYIFDFRTQKTEIIWKGQTSDLTYIDRNEKGDLIIQNKKGDFVLYQKNNPPQKMSPETKMALFKKEELWELKTNKIYRNNDLFYEIQNKEFSPQGVAWTEEGVLYIKNKDSLWEIIF